jgi:hypothetical protein
MQLHAPFIITPRLLPGLYIGTAFLSLESCAVANTRTRATFKLDIGGQEYTIDDLQSGCGGFRSAVEPFETLLSFMEAAAESVRYTRGTGRESDNATLFEPALMQWCDDNASEIERVRMDLQDANGNVLHNLISE